jgi:hypothetical protein
MESTVAAKKKHGLNFSCISILDPRNRRCNRIRYPLIITRNWHGYSNIVEIDLFTPNEQKASLGHKKGS